MTVPPQKLDGATVLEVADLSGSQPTGRTRHISREVELGEFGRLAIAQYDGDPGYYLFYCDSDWHVLTDTYHDSRERAVAQAQFEFDGVQFSPVERWTCRDGNATESGPGFLSRAWAAFKDERGSIGYGDLPARARTFSNFDEAAAHLERFHGVDPVDASARLHAVKEAYGFGGADNVPVDRTGNVFNHTHASGWGL